MVYAIGAKDKKTKNKNEKTQDRLLRCMTEVACSKDSQTQQESALGPATETVQPKLRNGGYEME